MYLPEASDFLNAMCFEPAIKELKKRGVQFVEENTVLGVYWFV